MENVVICQPHVVCNSECQRKNSAAENCDTRRGEDMVVDQSEQWLRFVVGAIVSGGTLENQQRESDIHCRPT